MEKRGSRRWQRRLAGFALGGVLVVGAIAGWLWHNAGRDAERFVGDARARGDAREYAVTVDGAVRLGVVPGRGASDVRALTAATRAEDVVTLGERTFVATAGGLLVYGDGAGATPGASPPSLHTHLDGLPALDLTAAARFGERALLGDRDGGLTILDGERAQAVHVALPRPAPIADIAVAGDVAYLLYTGLGVVAFDGHRAIDVGASAGIDLRAATAICSGATGLVVGLGDGAIAVERSGLVAGGAKGALGRVELGLGREPITALACPDQGATTDGALLVGTPFGLYRVDALDGTARVTPLRHDTFVTSIAPATTGLLVATFTGGVLLLDGATGRERAHLLERAAIHRLRAVGRGGERVIAVGPGGTWALSAGHFVAFAPPPPSLSGPAVTALAKDGAGQLWVGTFDRGIDIVDDGLVPRRHLPERGTAAPVDARSDQVNALLWRGTTREMLAATVHGLDVYGASGVHPLTVDDARARGEGVTAIAIAPSGGLALGSARGLTLVDGARTRTVYAFHGLANNHVYAVATVGDRVWAGTLAGLSQVDPLGPTAAPAVKRSIGTAQGLRAGWVSALASAPEGLYVGTYGGGVALVHGDGSLEDVSARIGRFHVDPGAMQWDRGALWVGTLEAGLLVYERAQNRWRRLDRLAPSRDVTAVLVDGDTIYLGGSAGLVRASRAAVEEALHPATPIVQTEGSS